MRQMPRTARTLRCALALVVVLGMCLVPLPLHAQDTVAARTIPRTTSDSITIVTLVDGSTLQGRIIEATPTSIRFRSAIGDSDIARASIRSMRTVHVARSRDGEVWPEDPSRTRLFFAPTGRTLRHDEKYFSDAYIFFPSFQVGVTDAFTLGAGMSIIPGLGFDEQLYYLTPKLGVVSGPNLNISVGALVAGAGRASSNSPFGIAYGVATFGGEDANITTGAGVAYSRGNTDKSALIMVGGTNRLSRGIALVSENYLYTGNRSSALLSGGVRFIGEKLSVDLAGLLSTAAPTIPIPYVAFIYKY